MDWRSKARFNLVSNIYSRSMSRAEETFIRFSRPFSSKGKYHHLPFARLFNFRSTRKQKSAWKCRRCRIQSSRAFRIRRRSRCRSTHSYLGRRISGPIRRRISLITSPIWFRRKRSSRYRSWRWRSKYFRVPRKFIWILPKICRRIS